MADDTKIIAIANAFPYVNELSNLYNREQIAAIQGCCIQEGALSEASCQFGIQYVSRLPRCCAPRDAEEDLPGIAVTVERKGLLCWSSTGSRLDP